jgi:hypothetical protein
MKIQMTEAHEARIKNLMHSHPHKPPPKISAFLCPSTRIHSHPQLIVVGSACAEAALSLRPGGEWPPRPNLDSMGVGPGVLTAVHAHLAEGVLNSEQARGGLE